MRFTVEFDTRVHRWLVFDWLNAGQTVGAHHDQGAAVGQAESEEQRWRRFGPGVETFALVAF